VEWRKSPKPLYSIVFLNLAMCFFGFSISFTKMTILWARVALCCLWVLLFVAASCNQGHMYWNACTQWSDRIIAILILMLYTVAYWYTMEWWHYVSGILALAAFLTVHYKYLDKLSVEEYVWSVNIWHLWIMIQIFVVPYSIPEGPLF